ncbi:MAG TPA: L-serine ammonia-lyase, iron-sulfur-dependent, subunit alpha [Gemmatimonadota bacterium]|nr:L-serine ammonia-lyase, iron-sulfur-dependent, subunit alpha [Gemmatimonadota bacterium]
MFASMREIVERVEGTGVPLWQVVLEEEIEDADTTAERVLERMAERLATMREAVERGLASDAPSVSGLLGGGARRFEEWRGGKESILGPFVGAVVARAQATMEVNARMGTIVATPTAGSSGILPAILFSAEEVLGLSEEDLVRGLLVAAGIGQVIVARASVSGAAGGCQAETGSAAAMAAAALTAMRGGTPEQVSESVAFTLQGMLGLICDPVAGLVEVPCLTRNVSGAVQAAAASELALAGLRFPIPADEVIDVMGQIGAEMDEKYRETAKGGLAATASGRRLAASVRWEGPEFENTNAARARELADTGPAPAPERGDPDG